MGASASPLSGNRHHYVRGWAPEPRWTCDGLLLWGGRWVAAWEHHVQTQVQTHHHTLTHHLPPPQQAAQTGCMNIHQNIMNTHIWLVSPPPLYSHVAKVWQRLHLQTYEFTAPQYAAPGLVTPGGSGGLSPRKASTYWEMFSILSSFSNRFRFECISLLKISARVTFFCQLSFKQTDINAGSENTLGRASHR